jgi:hypothetical protein
MNGFSCLSRTLSLTSPALDFKLLLGALARDPECDCDPYTIRSSRRRRVFWGCAGTELPLTFRGRSFRLTEGFRSGTLTVLA